jgi:ribA/ribD-fused uncharacterized protein
VGDPVVISYFDSFEGDNPYGFLTNFFVGAEPLRFRGREYLSGEHMFQAFKARTRADHDRIAAAKTPAEAKAEGKHYLRLRPDWERVKYDVMRLVLATKYRLEREEGPLLLATGDALLVEGTTCGDRVWGVDLKTGRAEHPEAALLNLEAGGGWEPGEGWQYSPGRNWLGLLAMARRAELVAEVRGCPPFPYGDLIAFVTDVPRG